MTQVITLLIDDIVSLIYPFDSHSKLNSKSHYLAKIAIVLLLLLTCFSVAVAYLMANDGHTFVTALYWSVVSIVSVGYGDVSMSTDADKSFVIIFIFAALFTLSTGVATILDVMEKEKFRKQQMVMLGLDLNLARLAELDVTGELLSKNKIILYF